jgi:hypothetical protein
MIFYLVLFTLILLYLYFKKYKRIKFLNQKQACQVLKYKPYFNNFNQFDLNVRDCENKDQCMNFYCQNIKSFSFKEKSVITNYINKVKEHELLKPYDWKFIRVTDKIENGYPHTQKDCIIISDYFMNQIIQNNGSHTLIHEQIHVLQRIATNKMNQHLTEVLNFYPVNNLKGFDIYKNKSRCNPDVDQSRLWVYKNKLLPLCIYDSNPNRLNDASYYGLKIKNNEIISELIPLHNFKDYEHLKLGRNYYNAYEVQAEYFEKLISNQLFG